MRSRAQAGRWPGESTIYTYGALWPEHDASRKRDIARFVPCWLHFCALGVGFPHNMISRLHALLRIEIIKRGAGPKRAGCTPDLGAALQAYPATSLIPCLECLMRAQLNVNLVVHVCRLSEGGLRADFCPPGRTAARPPCDGNTYPISKRMPLRI